MPEMPDSAAPESHEFVPGEWRIARSLGLSVQIRVCAVCDEGPSWPLHMWPKELVSDAR